MVRAGVVRLRTDSWRANTVVPPPGSTPRGASRETARLAEHLRSCSANSTVYWPTGVPARSVEMRPPERDENHAENRCPTWSAKHERNPRIARQRIVPSQERAHSKTDDETYTTLLDVRTLIPPMMRARVESAVRHALTTWTAATKKSDASDARVRHADNLPSLYLELEPDVRWSTLILDIEQFDALKTTSGKRWSGMRLTEIASGWDSGAIIFSSEEDLRRIGRAMQGPVGARFGVVAAPSRSRQPMLDAALASVLLGRWMHVEALCAAVPSALAHLRTGMQKLKPRQQTVLSQVFRNPSAWTVKTMAAASSGERRTLERAYADAGLPSPAKVLQWAKRETECQRVHADRETRGGA